MNAFNSKINPDAITGVNGQRAIKRAIQAVRAIHQGGNEKEVAEAIVGLAILLDTLSETVRIGPTTVKGVAARVRAAEANNNAVKALRLLVEGEFTW